MMEHMNKPTVSVITTTYNNADNLRQTMEMILSQDYEQIQYVIVDGGSTDETLKLIREYEPRFGERLKWISEPDRVSTMRLIKGIRCPTVISSDTVLTDTRTSM